MAFTASTFHLSHAGLLRTVLTRIAAPASPMTTTRSFVSASVPTHVGNTQRSFKDNFFWDLRLLKGLAITCSTISKTALPLFLPYSLKYAVRPSFPTCPLLSNSPASSVIHSMIFRSHVGHTLVSAGLWRVRGQVLHFPALVPTLDWAHKLGKILTSLSQSHAALAMKTFGDCVVCAL